MARTVGIREAKAELSRWVRVAHDEGEVVLTIRGRPAARLVPVVDEKRPTVRDILDELVDSGTLDAPDPSVELSRAAPVSTRRSVGLGELVRSMRR